MSDINDMQNEFIKDAEDFSNASIRVISDLQKKLKQLEAENENLKKMLEGNVPLIDINLTDLTLGISNEQLICESQLANLKAYAMVRDLTLEETRKFQAFTEVLDKIKKKNNSTDITVKKLSDNDLLKLINDDQATAK